MKYVPFEKFAKTAMTMFRDPLIFPEHKTEIENKYVVYFATETRRAFKEAKRWGQRQGVTVVYSNLTKLYVTHGASEQPHHPNQFENDLPPEHQLEYFSYLLHIHEILSCDVVICTQASNFCRVVDEVRLTAGHNARGYNADVSAETCESPPCIRRHGLANYENSVYDPKASIW
jgi:hypothetical protein